MVKQCQITRKLVPFNQYYVCHIHFHTRYAIMISDAANTGENSTDNENTGQARTGINYQKIVPLNQYIVKI